LRFSHLTLPAFDESAKGGDVRWASIGRLLLAKENGEGVVGFCFLGRWGFICLRSRPIRHVKAFGAAVLAALICAGIVLMLPGVSESTAAIVGAAAAMAGWSAVMIHSKA
jgi:hypothetical protein